MGYAPKEIREVGIDDFPVPAKQQFFHCDRRLLGIPPWPVGILLGWKIGFKACPRAAKGRTRGIGSRTSVAAVMQTRSRTFEMPSGLSLPLAFGIYTRLIGSGR